MKTLFNAYLNTFRGLSKEVWWLALITFVNRAGAMVIPFLSLYLRDDLKFSLSDVGWVMTCFGFGSLFGSWLGGKLSDSLGYYKTILFSLLGTGIGFFLLQLTTGFWAICLGFFLLIAVADMSRPAFFVALSAYSKPENKTRSLTLIRLAINLGFSAGPAIGGLIIASIGYFGLFWVDGITCILAGLLLFRTLNPKKAKETDQEILIETPLSPYKDHLYVLFLVALALFGVVFVQYFSTVPLYYKEVRDLTESQIGLLLGMNGFIIFIFEMPLIAFMERKNWSQVTNVILGLLLTGLSFGAFFINSWAGILIVGMAVATLGEMIAFPFGNAFALRRAKLGRQGAYMGLYSMSFSLSHIFGHNSGMQLVNRFDYEVTWIAMVGLCLVAVALLYYIKSKLEAEESRALTKI
ncbi:MULTISPECIES: MFS transporter [unclassified Leeuwenhoekiella]|uniref:MDR family MFS transporter n=1 Tax=unclassified Leeuwenhoekiella TaxID=2615029 RepID=UPI000C61FB98|nr:MULTISPECIES: MFS transporter [unclassified Leeuwenhoekiella]MAW96621.1 MFS transporter [Leeuwenhoekiella sp.]MBA81509.1 MFS transporter [Leeuwenhoekiella sp.]|tara:strand:- start:36682 stop:37908 length:1227 start_codon:yes stop_codon:yes gene_type:complete